MVFVLLRSVYIYYVTIIGLLSFSLNSIVIYLVFVRTSPSMKQYSFVILLGALANLVFCTVNLTTVQNVDIRDGMIFLFNLGPLRSFFSPVPLIASCMWMLSLLLVIISLPIQFYYRFLFLSTSRAVNIFKVGKVYACALAYVIVHIYMMAFVYYYRNEDVAQYKPILQKNPLYADETPKFIVGNMKEAFTALHVVNTQAIVLVAYSSVFYLSSKIYYAQQKIRATSTAATLRVQNQLTKIMLIQAMYPIVVVLLPIVLNYVCVFLSLDFPLIGVICSYVVALYNLVAPLSVIAIVPSYKRFVLHRLCSKSKAAPQNLTPKMTMFRPVTQLVLLSIPE